MSDTIPFGNSSFIILFLDHKNIYPNKYRSLVYSRFCPVSIVLKLITDDVVKVYWLEMCSCFFFFLPVTLTKIHHRCRLLFFWNLYDSRQCRRFHSFHASKNAKYLSIRNNSPFSLIYWLVLFFFSYGLQPFSPTEV